MWCTGAVGTSTCNGVLVQLEPQHVISHETKHPTFLLSPPLPSSPLLPSPPLLGSLNMPGRKDKKKDKGADKKAERKRAGGGGGAGDLASILGLSGMPPGEAGRYHNHPLKENVLYDISPLPTHTPLHLPPSSQPHSSIFTPSLRFWW